MDFIEALIYCSVTGARLVEIRTEEDQRHVHEKLRVIQSWIRLWQSPNPEVANVF